MTINITLFCVFTLFVTAVPSTSKECTPYNPFRINGTQAQNTTMCPHECTCPYCIIEETHMYASHEVRCMRKQFRHIPTRDIPVDVGALRLNYNHISGIKSNALANFREMTVLTLVGNILQYNNIDDDSFNNLTKLKILYLDYNRALSHIQRAWFLKLTSLENVYIRYSAVKTLQSGVFKNCVNLTTVHLTGNQLTSLPAEILRNHRFLKNVDFSLYVCYDVTISIVITTFRSAAFLTVAGFLIYAFRWDIRYWNQRRLLRKQYERLENEGPPPVDGVQIRYDAFVSYNSKDQDWVLKSALPMLEGPEFGFSLCVDFRDFVVGDAIADNISNAIKYSRKMLIVVTKNFAKSEWCYFEMEMARTRMFDNHEDIFVVVILESVPSRNMPTLLQKILRKKTYIEWPKHPDGQKVFWTRLAAALNSPNAHHDRLIN
ncbi:toll-like receptor 2 [Antedon mediterranea]|uniref:toll-like receptor 2 n=1 Tax=Antedon mediterranea TaxID=105859 RepID=UPI003AF486A1